jgi:hypothetical protein
MERVAIVARLKEGSAQRADELVRAGPPFDLAGVGIARHSIYISSGEAVFVFEGHQVEWIVDELVDDRFQTALQGALDQWREIVDGEPRVARERFGWDVEQAEPAQPSTAGAFSATVATPATEERQWTST